MISNSNETYIYTDYEGAVIVMKCGMVEDSLDKGQCIYIARK